MKKKKIPNIRNINIYIYIYIYIYIKMIEMNEIMNKWMKLPGYLHCIVGVRILANVIQ